MAIRDRLPATPLLVLVVWTVFLWVSRLRNVFSDDDLTAFGTAWRVGVVVVFVALAVLATTGRLVGVLIAWTIGFWLVRGGGILLDGDHDAGFKVIHTALMAVSIGLAMWAWRSRSR